MAYFETEKVIGETVMYNQTYDLAIENHLEPMDAKSLSIQLFGHYIGFLEEKYFTVYDVDWWEKINKK